MSLKKSAYPQGDGFHRISTAEHPSPPLGPLLLFQVSERCHSARLDFQPLSWAGVGAAAVGSQVRLSERPPALHHPRAGRTVTVVGQLHQARQEAVVRQPVFTIEGVWAEEKTAAGSNKAEPVHLHCYYLLLCNAPMSMLSLPRATRERKRMSL